MSRILDSSRGESSDGNGSSGEGNEQMRPKKKLLKILVFGQVMQKLLFSLLANEKIHHYQNFLMENFNLHYWCTEDSSWKTESKISLF